MFGARIICIECAFFSSYRFQNYGSSGKYASEKTIDPLIPTEYRILVYILPSFISLLINFIRLLITDANIMKYARRYPQIIISSCFTPFMFEGSKETEKNIRIWKLGTILNAFFIGCLPQVVLLAMDSYRGVTTWEFVSLTLHIENIFENNDALFKSRYGNTLFAAISCFLFVFLIVIFFFTHKIFKNNRIYCKCFTILCCPCPTNCSNLSGQLFQPKTSESNSNSPENDCTQEVSELEQVSKRNQTPVTQIFLYTRQGKVWLKGKPLADNLTALNQVSKYLHLITVHKILKYME